MDAPLYPPASAYEAPIAAPYQRTVKNTPLAELLRTPAAWAIVMKHAPQFKMVTSTPMLQPHLGSMTVSDMMGFGVVKKDVVDSIDAELRALPDSAWGAK
jgi:hypothetical protein